VSCLSIFHRTEKCTIISESKTKYIYHILSIDNIILQCYKLKTCFEVLYPVLFPFILYNLFISGQASFIQEMCKFEGKNITRFVQLNKDIAIHKFKIYFLYISRYVISLCVIKLQHQLRAQLYITQH